MAADCTRFDDFTVYVRTAVDGEVDLDGMAALALAAMDDSSSLTAARRRE
jgi:hypothetical protein